MTDAHPGVAGVLLAAGGGTRLGTPKALLRLGDVGLLARGVRMLREGGCEPVVVVLGAEADEAARLVDPGVVTVVNPEWSAGMSRSVRAGLLAARRHGALAAVLALVDQPFVGAEAVARLVAAWREGARAAAATYGGEPRNPVLLDRAVWDEVLSGAHGDEGARAWLRAHAGEVAAVPCDDVADPADIDTPEQLEAAVRRWQQ